MMFKKFYLRLCNSICDHVCTIICPPNLLQLLVRRRVGHEQTVAVAHRHAAEDPAAADRGVHHGDYLVLESIFNSPISYLN